MYEHRHAPLISRKAFRIRFARHAGIALIVVAASLLMGTYGYHAFVGLDWIDALVNAAMILTGMGPLSPIPTTEGKLFATAYALFSGVVFLSTVAVLLAPIVHRFLHRFHIGMTDNEKD